MCIYVYTHIYMYVYICIYTYIYIYIHIFHVWWPSRTPAGPARIYKRRAPPNPLIDFCGSKKNPSRGCHTSLLN